MGWICSSYKSLVKLKHCQDWIFFFLKSSGMSMLVEIFVLGKLKLTAFPLKTSASSGWGKTACSDDPHTEEWQTESCWGPVAADSASAELIILDVLKQSYLKHLQDSIYYSHILPLSSRVLSHLDINPCGFLGTTTKKKVGFLSCFVNQPAVGLCISMSQPLVKAGGEGSLILQESAENEVPCPPQLWQVQLLGLGWFVVLQQLL